MKLYFAIAGRRKPLLAASMIRSVAAIQARAAAAAASADAAGEVSPGIVCDGGAFPRVCDPLAPMCL